MRKRFVVKDFKSGKYYQSPRFFKGYSEDTIYAETFETEEDAIDFIKSQSGTFQIETIYSH